jgi:8-oxo-dGTP diphosphatase
MKKEERRTKNEREPASPKLPNDADRSEGGRRANRDAVVVVAAVIEREDRFLVTLRQSGTHLEGYWEFPGGKVYPHETHREALRRELFEELDIVGEVGGLLHTVTHSYPEKTVELHFYRCDFEGEPKPMMGQQLQWVRRDRLKKLRLPEADRDLLWILTSP